MGNIRVWEMKNDYTNRLDFGFRGGGLVETKSGGVNFHYYRARHGTIPLGREIAVC